MKRTTLRMSPLHLATAFAVAGVTMGHAAPAASFDLSFPAAAESTGQRVETMTSFRLPVGPFLSGAMQTELTEGPLDQQAFRIEAPALSTLELLQPLRDQIAAAGFKTIFECETEACGGFDFRFGTDILPEPDMHVDLGDFRYLAAERAGPTGKEYLSLVVSRSNLDGFVQVTRIGGAALPQLTTSTKNFPAKPAADQTAFALPTPIARSNDGTTALTETDLGKRLELGPAQVLEDLVFASGSSALQEGSYASLASLATWLKADSTRHVVLVGHTDDSGGLTGNVRLSKLRAESVRQYLLRTLSVDPAQVTAEGVGYLSPRDSNQTDEGRQRNRRVEVMLTSTPLLAP